MKGGPKSSLRSSFASSSSIIIEYNSFFFLLQQFLEAVDLFKQYSAVISKNNLKLGIPNCNILELFVSVEITGKLNRQNAQL